MIKDDKRSVMIKVVMVGFAQPCWMGMILGRVSAIQKSGRPGPHGQMGKLGERRGGGGDCW